MDRRAALAGLASAALLGACAPRQAARPLVGADGLPLPTLWRITEADAQAIPFRMQEGLNTLRRAAGAGPVELDPALTAAAATHSRDMAVQNRPWHFGSDGSSPLDRLRRVGYRGGLVGEVISETYEDDTTTLAAWARDPVTRDVILDRRATRMGVAWLQEESGKIWWTMVLGN
ncbi:CAP domain-containing protein [Rubellimicrobium sp. CFH 75288]|uniref:CAP domain-containing protein n=1 Tax=Rubellimicrobium sp. CFH 75288 TaxID=2697034 RepID=UPI0014133F29|nr:CAP domain-containing protein [Rubellimicrobium sp. CFH 75288]NAZ37750.1 CAP domain-containing protein [Rubellimicrobium sp. CFH 75288]